MYMGEAFQSYVRMITALLFFQNSLHVTNNCCLLKHMHVVEAEIFTFSMKACISIQQLDQFQVETFTLQVCKQHDDEFDQRENDVICNLVNWPQINNDKFRDNTRSVWCGSLRCWTKLVKYLENQDFAGATSCTCIFLSCNSWTQLNSWKWNKKAEQKKECRAYVRFLMDEYMCSRVELALSLSTASSGDKGSDN